MNFVASLSPGSRDEVASGKQVASAGDTYISTLVRLMEIGDQLKIQSVAVKHARACAAKRDWDGVHIGLAVLCCAARDIRKIAATVNERIGPELDDCVTVYGDSNA